MGLEVVAANNLRRIDRGLRVLAPAKLNLCLDLLGQRADGFHELETVMTTVRLFDTVELRTPDSGEANGNADGAIRFTAADAAGRPLPAEWAPSDDSNLAVRALRVLFEQTGESRPAELKLFKRIPSQAGMGGASSDAAAVLVAANRLWRLGLSTDDLLQAAAQLGSDVPFFVAAIMNETGHAAALCRGRGERIEPIAAPAGKAIVIAKPAVGLSTASVYRSVEQRRCDDPRSQSVARRLAEGDWRGVGGEMRNALQAAAMRLAPELRAVAAAMGRLGLVAHQLTGSGAAWFGLCPSLRHARHAAARLRADHALWACATTT
ncbi:4-diphosphocytidyl-2-C-methyl-D-erythritol kinase [Pseudobythopirellula maris]|uniref:4-diphosphocytidyl-2-C-methyl-D-erythritol kinase n=2 Tax=Pseudobythopirellula maris TaxID=2527991 RepID=A0A5C5ZND7_9BACT|nr:4-diphosphocytidyl-2-C-methyl-D-erythritol kinase [Pseudobythopirellula maris]